MKKLKISKLCGCLATTVAISAIAFTASAAEVDVTVFNENATTVQYALDNSGAGQYGTWASTDGLDGLTVVSSTVGIDYDSEAPLNFTFKKSAAVADSPTITGSFVFGRAYDTLPTVDGAKAGLCLKKNDTAATLCYISDGAWAESTVATALDPAELYDIEIKTSGDTVTYSIAIGGTMTVIGTGTIGADATLTSAQFAGNGSFTAFAGNYSYTAAAMIGETRYATLAAAEAAVKNGEVVKILDEDQTWVITRTDRSLVYSFDAAGYDPTIDSGILGAGYVFKAGKGIVMDFDNGSGTENDPYQIASETDLNTIRSAMSNSLLDWNKDKYFQQTANIALTAAFDGIGTRDLKDVLADESIDNFKAGAFQGVYDGNGNTISGLILKTGDYVGFFNGTYGATIKNLKISLGNATGWSDAATGQVGAVFVGVSVNTTIEGCETVVDGEYNTFNASKTAAGLIGYAAHGTIITGCTNNLNIVSSANEKAAGFVACAQAGKSEGSAGVVVENCENNGNVTSTGAWASGLVGYSDLKVTFKGANTVTGTITGTAQQSVIGISSGSVAVEDGATFTVPSAYKTVNKNAVDGLWFGALDGEYEGYVDVVKTADVAMKGDYKVMANNPGDLTVALAGAKDVLTFDVTFAPTWTPKASEVSPAPAGYKLNISEPVDNIITCSCIQSEVEIVIESSVLPANTASIEVKQGENVIEPTGSAYKLQPTGAYTITLTPAAGWYFSGDNEPKAVKTVETPEAKTYAANDFSEFVATQYAASYVKDEETVYAKTIADAVAGANGATITVILAGDYANISFPAEATLTVADGNLTVLSGATAFAGNITVADEKFIAFKESLPTYGTYTITLGGATSAIYFTEDQSEVENLFTHAVVSSEETEGEFMGLYKHTMGAAPGPVPTVIDEDVSEDYKDLEPEEKAVVDANVGTLVEKCGSAGDVKAWTETVYGTGNKIPAEDLAATSADLTKISVDYQLPIMTTNATVEVAAGTGDDAGKFVFTIKDGLDTVSLEAAKADILQTVKYAADLGTTPAYDANKITVEQSGNTLKADFKDKSAAQGFMIMDLQAK